MATNNVVLREVEDTDDIVSEVMKNEEIAALTRANESFRRFFQTLVTFTREDTKSFINSRALQRADTIDRDIQSLNTSLITLKEIEAMANTMATRLQMSSDFARMLEYIKTDDNMLSMWEQLMTMMRLMEGEDE